MSDFGRYAVKRDGLRWTILETGSDGIVRDLYIGRFWRWIIAARIAQACQLAYAAGAFVPSEEVE